MSKLFTPTEIGPYMMGHRIVMAPLTRMRSDAGDRPNALMAEYYSQRASKGGLIVAEATPVSRQGYGYAKAPGVYSDDQIAGWRHVTDAVHAKGGRIFLQLWHVGRQSHPDLQPGRGAPVAPSAIKAEGHAYSDNGEVEFTKPRALDKAEIPAIVETYRAGSQRALGLLRRRRDSWGQRLSARPVPARRVQHAHRRIRRQRREPRPFSPRGHSSGGVRLGRQSGRRASRAERQLWRHAR